MTKELDSIITELENWHYRREKLNNKPNRNKSLNMDTLPKAIFFLKEYKKNIT